MLANILWQPRISVDLHSVEQPAAEVATRLYCGVSSRALDVCIKLADAIRLGLFDYFPEFGLVGRAVYVSHLSSHAWRHPSRGPGYSGRSRLPGAGAAGVLDQASQIV